MKAFVLALLVLVFPNSLFGSEFSEFRIPKHNWHSSRADLSAGLWRAAGALERSQAIGSVFASTDWGFDSDRLQTSIFVSAFGQGASLREEGSPSIVFSPSLLPASRDFIEAEYVDANEGWRIGGELRIHPWQSAVSLIFRGAGEARYSQAWSSAHARREFADTSGFSRILEDRGQELCRYDYVASYDASIGLGRVRDATAVYQAYLLERRLLDSGALTGPLSHATRERIAALYFIEPRYRSVHERPEKFFWRDLERILFEDGALSLDGYNVLRALEPYLPKGSRLMRRIGIFAGLTAEGRHGRRIVRSDRDSRFQTFVNDTLVASGYAAFGGRDARSDDDVWVGGEAELHYPLGMRAQVDLTSRLLFPTRDLRHGMDLASAANAAYWIADRWSLSASIRHSRTISRASVEEFIGSRFGLPRTSGWSVGYGAEFGFYLEDRVLLTLTASEIQGKGEDLFSPFRATTNGRQGSINLGISYHFLGGLKAPGLIQPQRLIPPGDPLY